jgi:hypothetical protein
MQLRTEKPTIHILDNEASVDLQSKVQLTVSSTAHSPPQFDGWYLGTLTEHYHCHIIFCTKTCSEQISDTVVF